MAEPIIPPRAKLFIGIITAREDLLITAEKRLIRRYGPIDYRTLKIPFTNTDYYRSLGTTLFKVLFSFKRLVRREQIVDIKLHSNQIEKKLSEDDKRLLNIDPGYLTLSNVYLASCKEFFHRIYLQKGIYLENEFHFYRRQYHPWDWTYPDYRKPEYIDFFHELRKIYYRQIR